MIDRLVWIETDNTYPYRNLAMEEYMTLHVPKGTCIMYLWQNRHTVVIGKNQNCWKECRVNFLEEENGYLVRRLSGGGAVFHDLGNLNFTFIARAEDYDISRQLDVILEGVKRLGIHAEKTGRNDITVDGRKFSGNAFYRTGEGCYHHGTVLIRADKENMSRYLNVSKEKLASKGVTSVKSRVTNLCEFKPDITVDEVKKALAEAFSEVYGLRAERMDEGDLPQDELAALTEKFESWQWKYGRKIPFEYEMERRFPWGNIQLQLHVDAGVITDVNVFSDAMDQAAIEQLAGRLKGCAYAEEDMCRAVAAAGMDANAGADGAGDSMCGKAEDAGNGACDQAEDAGDRACGRAEATGNDKFGMPEENQMKKDIMALIRESL